jgi:site-specific recombinase XerD
VVALEALPSATVTVPVSLVDVAARAAEYAQARRAERTWRGYRSDWRQFTAWCGAHDLVSLPASADVVAAYLADRAGTLKVATLQRHLSSIAVVHREAGHPAPKSERLAMVWAGIRRTYGTAQHGKAPLLAADVRALVATCGDRPIDVRDRGLLLLGFVGAFRRSELVGLNVEDVERSTEGLVITLRRSKTDQEGAGRRIGIPFGATVETCPVAAFDAWIALLGDSAESMAPLFRPVDRHGNVAGARLSGGAVAQVVKRAAERAGLDPTQYAGHSLRSGFATSAAAAGASERSIMRQTGHRSLPVLRRYIRDGSLWCDNAATLVGL